MLSCTALGTYGKSALLGLDMHMPKGLLLLGNFLLHGIAIALSHTLGKYLFSADDLAS